MWFCDLAAPERELVTIVVCVVEEAPSSATSARVFSLVRPVYQPSGLSPVMRVWISIARAMCSRSSSIGNGVIIDPSIPMRADLMPVLQRHLRHARIALERHGHSKHRERQLSRPEGIENAPDANP